MLRKSNHLMDHNTMWAEIGADSIWGLLCQSVPDWRGDVFIWQVLVHNVPLSPACSVHGPRVRKSQSKRG